MTYSHSFTPEFYYRGDDEDLVPTGRPLSVRQALYSMPSKRWREMCAAVFPDVVRKEVIDLDMVMEKIRETDTVSNLDSPVRVWIDPEGFFAVEVYDQGGN